MSKTRPSSRRQNRQSPIITHPSKVDTNRPMLGIRDSSHDTVAGLVAAYHEQALAQAHIQFWVSVTAAAIGFVMILYPVITLRSGDILKFSNALPGAVMDAVAYLFFRQASETRERATELYDRLRNDQQVRNAISLVSSMENCCYKSAVQAKIAMHMSGLQVSLADIDKMPVPCRDGVED